MVGPGERARARGISLRMMCPFMATRSLYILLVSLDYLRCGRVIGERERERALSNDTLASMTGVGAWADAYNKAVNFVNQLTIEEKVSLALSIICSMVEPKATDYTRWASRPVWSRLLALQGRSIAVPAI